jgi:hypothetical protein
MIAKDKMIDEYHTSKIKLTIEQVNLMPGKSRGEL